MSHSFKSHPSKPFPFSPGNEGAELQGQIERITFYNEENGFTVAKLKASGQRELVTIVGSLPGINAGEVLKLWGEWGSHPKFGYQFKFHRYQTIKPATVVGIEKYLGSGLIRGIGPIMARRLVQKFGTETLEVIERAPQRLQEVEGIGPRRIQMIQEAWEAQKEIREVMVFLQGHGVSSAYAARIYKHYGRDAIAIVRENPYRLAADISGIGFITADKIAQNLGIPRDSMARIEAGLLYVLHQLSDEGHVYYPYESLIEEGIRILEVERELILQAFDQLAKERKIVWEDLGEPILKEGAMEASPKAVYLAGYFAAEMGIAWKIREILKSPSGLRPIHIEQAIDWAQARLNMVLAEKQREAIAMALQNKAMVLTGGPGTGKTTIIRAILEIFRRLTPRILLAAPTGRAAKRMSEATGWEAKTIHRLLEWNFETMGFRRDHRYPLEADVVIIDETSMIDTLLMFHLLRAIPSKAVFIMVGDVDQIPSVGPGMVLKDMIESGVIPVVRLTEIFRQAMGSQIVVNAHRINQGLFPRIEPSPKEGLRDFYFIEREDPEALMKVIVELVTQKIPSRFGMDPLHDIQVLTPMHRGILGTGNLNQVLQEALNPSPIVLTRGGRTFKTGDRVMQITNDYEREVFNGDIGWIQSIEWEEQVVKVDFDGRIVSYDFSDLEELTLSYAASIHKAQGSEYPAVVLPLHISHYIMLQRNLVYTGVTRAKKLLVIVGMRKALRIAIRNEKTQKRFTGLERKLRAEALDSMRS